MSVHVELPLFLFDMNYHVAAIAICRFFVNTRLDKTHAKEMGLDQATKRSDTM